MIACNTATAHQILSFKNQFKHSEAFRQAVFDRIKSYRGQGFSKWSRSLHTIVKECYQHQKESVDPSASEASLERLNIHDNRPLNTSQPMQGQTGSGEPSPSQAILELLNIGDNRPLTASQLTQDQPPPERRHPAYRHELMGRVASNRASADDLLEFEKLIRRDIVFPEQAREQLRLFAKSEATEEADRLYFALAHVLVEEKPLPLRDPLLPRREAMAEYEKWYPIATGKHTNQYLRTFVQEMLTNKGFVRAVTFACERYRSRGSASERGMSVRLEHARQYAQDLRGEIQATAIREIQSDHAARGPGESASGTTDQARRNPARGTSPVRSSGLHSWWTVILIEMLATENATQEMLRLYQHKFKTETAFRQLVLRHDREYRSSRSTAGYEKAMRLRAAVPQPDHHPAHGVDEFDDDRRLELIRKLTIDRNGGKGIGLPTLRSIPSRSEGLQAQKAS